MLRSSLPKARNLCGVEIKAEADALEGDGVEREVFGVAEFRNGNFQSVSGAGSE